MRRLIAIIKGQSFGQGPSCAVPVPVVRRAFFVGVRSVLGVSGLLWFLALGELKSAFPYLIQ